MADFETLSLVCDDKFSLDTQEFRGKRTFAYDFNLR